MKRTPLYSAASRSRPAAPPDRTALPADAPQAAAAPRASRSAAGSAPAQAPAAAAAARPGGRRRDRWAWAGGGALAGLALALGSLLALQPPAQRLTQKDIDKAVLHTLATKPLPSPAAKAAEIVRPSVVRVVGLSSASEAEAKDDDEGGVGSGVVITDRGVILTNLHVVAGSRRIKVTFADGMEADASVINVQPENDLAVLQASKLPDDLTPATMRSTGDLRPGDRVTAVGFPFGIGPSVSHGVVSGLKREFRSPEGKQVLTNLIQFDAAANPGNSGGPLVTDEGEVVGIVTAILNPVQQRFFVGIGFAVPIENAAAGAGMPPF
ncbi:trypsin-like peptidase domain-containing protein [Aquincola sp. MAHUQ-54]|uniref:Trypsin-like peptidase domain-containing protein n=1 Tax=Aquincola agrisoli TaxID=3119538 RepID=A0AAW9Q938_9BURK